MNHLVHHLRGNLVAYLALFVALGGTSYAAVSLPAGSVGTRQLRNGAVTKAKLNGAQFGGYVHAWAYVNADGRMIVSRGFKSKVRVVAGSAGGIYTVDYALVLRHRQAGCVAMASIAEPGAAPYPQLGSAPADVYSHGTGVAVFTYDAGNQASKEPFVVEVLC